jgi:ligand-binding sensor domain-containing protein/signal transduction histidine kinase
MKTFGSSLLTTVLVVCLSGPLAAQQLSMRRYNVADGLAHDSITSLLEDSRGYLWIGTFEGLSRFDGNTFVSYDTDDGIGNYLVNDLAEDSQGRLWVATNGGGISLLDDTPGASKLFSSYLPGRGAAANVNVLLLDGEGRLWCGTDGGIYVADINGEQPVFTLLGFPSHGAVAAAASRDRVWFGVLGVGLVEFRNGASTVYPVPWSPPLRFQDLLTDSSDSTAVLIASDSGFFRFSAGNLQRIPADLGPRQVITDLLADGIGGYWLATNEGLLHRSPAGTRRYSLDRALGGRLSSLITDRGGNLWFGMGGAGLARIRQEQIISYTPTEGLPDADVTALVEDRAGGIHAVSRRGTITTVTADGLLASRGPASPAANRPLVPSDDGWWAIGSDGAYHVPGLVPQFGRATRLPVNIIPAFSLPSSVPLAHIDERGSLWFASTEPAVYRITRPSSAHRQVDRWPLDVADAGAVTVLGADAGGIWLANMTTLARFSEGKLTIIPPLPGMANIQPRAFMRDRQGGVWIGLRFGGVMMTQEPSAPRPRFVRYSVEDGLSSDAVWALAEDRQGLIYLGTGRGLDQLDPKTRRVRHFSTDDGLPGNVITDLHVDGTGAVWVASMGGIARLELSFAPARRAPVPIYISRILLAGVPHALPERGATRVGGLQLEASARNLRIDFVSPGFQHAGRIRYQYMLEGVDTQWSPPAVDQTINYARLASGQYRFHVRAITADGRISDEPAVVDFLILPPFWSRPWFIATLFGGVLTATLSVQRMREQRRRSLAAIRRQVATDLHDDVGSGLAQIAILSEVAKRRAGSEALPALNEVADLARSLRDSMSDIVWAVDPGRDVPIALVERMRQVTFNLLSSSTEVTFQAPDDRQLARLDLGPDRRRHLLLIFKEAITNIARHARATKVAVSLAIEDGSLMLTIRDNGVGFDVVARHDGHGLENLASRSRSIGAAIEIRSRRGDGTIIGLTVPLRRRTRMFRWLPRKEPHG